MCYMNKWTIFLEKRKEMKLDIPFGQVEIIFKKKSEKA